MRSVRKLLIAAILAGLGALAVACGGDDNGTPGPAADAGKETGSSSGSSSGTSGSSGGGDSGPEASPDAGCDFAVFVLDLINNQTKENNAPSQDLGEACKDKQDQKDFASLFP
jgi:hypothetical protein